MPFIRLCDSYNDHPKFDRLSDGAFRLWHQAMGFCRRYQTDGYIPMTTVRGLKAYGPKRLKELLTPWQPGAQPLWHTHGIGIRVHDYLEWNPSKDEENERRGDTRDRMKTMRERRHIVKGAPNSSISPKCDAVTTPVTNAFVTTPRESVTNGNVLDRIGSDLSSVESKKEEKTDPFLDDVKTDRAARFIERYQALYHKHRHGALYALKPARDYAAAVTLCSTWADDARLDKLAVIFLTTDHRFAEEGSRTVPQFLALASWADGKLAEFEAKKAGVR